MKALRILLADDHEVVRRGLRALLESRPHLTVCAEAPTGREAVEQTLRLKPDVVVMDITMPELNGLEATRQILKALPGVEILVLSMHQSEELVREVLAAGARGYILKSDAGKDLVNAVEALGRHQPYFTPKVSEIVLEGYIRGGNAAAPASPAGGRISPREREVLQLLAEGKSNKEVASVLNISVKTVETHRSRIMDRLNLHSMSDLVRYAIRNNLIDT